MVINEWIFLLHAIFIMSVVAAATRLGQHVLVATLAVFGVLSNLFIAKQITLFGFNVVSTDIFSIGGILGLIMLQECWGQLAAKKMIVINVFILNMYIVLCFFHLWYLPNSFDNTHFHFAALLPQMPKIIIASFIASTAGQVITMYLSMFFSKILKGNYFAARTIATLSISQLVDTTLFSFIALYGVVHSISHIIFVSYTIKLLVSACGSFYITFLRKFFNLSNNQ
jgi:queuosine precursor transporter